MADFNSFFKMTTVRDVKIAHPQWAVTWIHYTKLIRTRFQYADPDTMEVIYTLADAIEAEGQVLQNLVVRKSDADQYEILAGHKRTKACQILVEERGLTQYEFLPCIIMEKMMFGLSLVFIQRILIMRKHLIRRCTGLNG